MKEVKELFENASPKTATREASKPVDRVRTHDIVSPWRHTTDLIASDQEKYEFSDKLLGSP